MLQNKTLVALLLVLLLIILTYSVLLIFIASRQESLLFHPVPLPPDHALGGQGWTESTIPVPGASLSTLHLRQRHAVGLVFILHGNSGNLASWMPDAGFYRSAGYDVFIFDYRGFGKSNGKINSEDQLHEDVLNAWNSVAPEYRGRPIVVYGRSLGTGLAVRLATHASPAQLVLVSPYASFVQLACEKFPWVPSFLLRYPMRTDRWLANVKAPVLMIAGAQDTLVPAAHAQKLHVAYPRTELVILPTADHSNIAHQPEYLALYRKRLAEISLRARGI